MKLVLGSSSPRRIQLLKDLGLKPKIIKPEVPEIPRLNELPLAYVKRLSLAKANAVAKKMKATDFAILSADTVVVLGTKILEKPKSKSDAVRMLTSLSGKKHKVLTSWCWVVSKSGKKRTSVHYEITEVEFYKKPLKFWQWYASTKEPMDKAGSYAAQGIGIGFIRGIRGSWSNVVGLPIAQVLVEFENDFGFDLLSLK